ncbi:PLP-dependent aminotransferase family protein [Serratia odorifera]|nr:PLP-dependent aminotransferase family protein [Serratia odorifera]
MMRPFFASLRLDSQLAEPLYRQIYLRIKQAIGQGVLPAGSRLPSVRGLASDLGVARATVESAYAQLVAEGFLQSRGQAGTYVSAQLPPLARQLTLAAAMAMPTVKPPASPFSPDGATLAPFQLGLPALDAFPRAVWQRIVARQLRATTALSLAHPPASGLSALREAISHYLALSRGIHCGPDQIFICSGYQAQLDLIVNTLLQPGDAVWLEDPGYPITRPLLHAAGIQTVPVPVDSQGMNIDLGMARRPDARMAVLTPTHQSPLGVSLSLARRMALLEWAQQRQAWVVEDDYDSEFRYVGRPLPPLKSLDGQQRVLYAGSFSKTLFPSLRLSYLVVPAAQVAAFEQVARQRLCGSPPLIQASVAAFISQGHFYRHLKRMRPLYRQRRQWLADALQQQLGSVLSVAAQAGGIQLLARLTTGSDSALAAAAWRDGLAVQALSDWQQTSALQQGILLGFTNFTQQWEAEQAVARLAAALVSLN